MAISSIAASETTYPVQINGYACYSAAEVLAARSFTDPHAAEKAAKAQIQTRDSTRDVNNPLKSGTRGTRLNILA